jgi:hypothetical protein
MNHLHDYSLLFDTGEVIVEYCIPCKKKLVTRKDSRGRHDEQEWLKEHEKDFIQRGDKRWERVYGKS